jgi:hypothetical protein
MRRYQPRNVYNLKNADPQQAAAAQGQINNLEDEQDFVIPGEMGVNELGSASKTFNVDQFHTVYINEFIKALGTPTSRLFEKGALTEASANSAKETAMLNLVAFQRMMNRDIVRLIVKPWYIRNPAYDANGVIVPWTAAQVELNWGMPAKPDTGPEAAIELIKVKPTAFLDDEVRRFASDKLGMELDQDKWNLRSAASPAAALKQAFVQGPQK